jgi:hypothetical protein
MTIRFSTTDENIIDALGEPSRISFFASLGVFIVSQYDTLMYLRNAYHITKEVLCTK